MDMMVSKKKKKIYFKIVSGDINYQIKLQKIIKQKTLDIFNMNKTVYFTSIPQIKLIF